MLPPIVQGREEVLKFGVTRNKCPVKPPDGKRFEIRARVHTISGYSAHADKQKPVNFVRRMRLRPADTRIVHGDEDAKTRPQQELRTLLPDARVVTRGISTRVTTRNKRQHWNRQSTPGRKPAPASA